MDLKLTDYDVDLANGELSFVRGIEAVRQDVEMKLRTWVGETPYDTTVGLPYLQVIFRRGVNVNAVRTMVEVKLLSIDGVTDVLELNVDFDRAGRELTITGRVAALDEEFPIDVTVEPEA